MGKRNVPLSVGSTFCDTGRVFGGNKNAQTSTAKPISSAVLLLQDVAPWPQGTPVVGDRTRLGHK